MSYIENSKTYTGAALENIFFRPMLSGASAVDLGVRVLYNMPIPTVIQLWDRKPNVLQQYSSSGWSGGAGATKQSKEIKLSKVKAEMGFSASDYFTMVYETIANKSNLKMDDLSGTDLEEAETAIFKQAVAESIRCTMWLGDNDLADGINTFNGFMKYIFNYSSSTGMPKHIYTDEDMAQPDGAVDTLELMWLGASEKMKDLKNEGQLAFFVTSDVYHLYEKYLDSRGVDTAYTETINGRPTLAYHGIPVIDIRVSSYLPTTVYHQSFAILTDRRNLVMAVNTSDFPGNEVRMWYNPDLMENRQRAVFMAGCDILDKELISYAYKS